MAAAAITAVGRGVQAVGAIQQGKAEAAAYDYNSQLDEQNANQSRLQAAEEERRVRILGRKTLGSIRANAGASGISLEGSSAADVLAESASNVELDALTIRDRGEAKAVGYENSRRLNQFRKRSALDASYLSATSHILSGAAGAVGSSGSSGSSGGGTG